MSAYGFYMEFNQVIEGGRMVTVRQKGKHSVVKGVQTSGEPQIVEALLKATTMAELRRICRRSVWLSGKSPGHLHFYLVQAEPRFAQQFLQAMKDRHYPRSRRPTTLRKKLWFLSRALAGAVDGISTRTAINLVPGKNPEEMFRTMITPYYAMRVSRKRRQR